jgi:hypothetical protein
LIDLDLISSALICSDGSKLVKRVKNELDETLLNAVQEDVVRPIAIIFLSVKLPMKDGIQVV